MDGEKAGTLGKRLYDGYCDPLGVNDRDFPVEDTGTTARSLMDYTESSTIAPLQKETLRALAKLVPGASFTNVNDPAGSLVAPPRACEPACGLPLDLFLTEAGMAQTPPLAVTTFWHAIRGPLPESTSNDYLAFVDLDDDSSTGCDPSALFPGHAGFSGAELVSQVTVSTVGGGEQATPTVWRCQGGSFEQLSDPAIEALVLKPGTADVSRIAADPALAVIVSVTLPDALRGPAATRVRLQAIAERPGAGADRLPAAGHGGVFSLIPPALPECTLARPLLAPGGRTTVRASGLTPNRAADIYVGDRIVATEPRMRRASPPSTSPFPQARARDTARWRCSFKEERRARTVRSSCKGTL